MRESRLWFLFVLAGACMIVLLGAHLFVMHLETFMGYLGITIHEPLAYAEVMARAKSVSWLVIYMALLILALYHGLYGVRSVLLETINMKHHSTVTAVIVIVGLIAAVFGSYIVIQSYMMGGL
ncbi:MAG: succinate dehydrogenase / fumarate reductase, rane anchor subunit [Clostridia bacterium]|nr:succinate dehydrogenase / fumarate reductase, rane anchor subunit [Clostridia bacterium]